MFKLGLLIFWWFFSNCSSTFFQEVDVRSFDVSHLIRSVSYPKSDKIVVLHKYSDEFILLGGRNRVYNISLQSMSEIDRYEWSTNENSRKNCAEISQKQSDCENYIRTFFELTTTRFLLCGTHGLQPICAEFQIGKPNAIRLISGVGMSPIDADSTSQNIRSNQNLITLNVADLSSSQPLLIRRNVLKMWKGIENDSILRTPRGQNSFEQAQFLSMHKVENEILFFFSETPMEGEGCGLHKVARIGRVCADDPGGQLSYSKEWSSYNKARLDCSIEEEHEDTFSFNQFASITESSSSFYGAFRSQLAGIGASAICKYDKQLISKKLSSVYKNNSTKKNGCSRAEEIDELTKMRVKPLIKEKIISRPLYVFHGKDRFTNIATHESIKDLSNRLFDILYVATNLGNILKIVVPLSKGSQMISRHSLTLRVLPVGTKIIEMSVFSEKLVNNMTLNYLLIITNQSILKIPTTTCNMANSCAECLAMGDPECAWAEAGECINISTERLRANYSSQDSGNCDVLNENNKPISVPPLKTRDELTCLCDSTTHLPCTTEVIQKEIIHTKTFLTADIWKYLIIFFLGCIIGSLSSLFFSNKILLQKSNSSRSSSSITHPITSARAPITAFTTSSIIDDMFNSTNSVGRMNSLSMHSSIRTYC